MALLDYLFPPQQNPMMGLLGADEEKMRQQAQQAGLLNAGLGIIAASGPSRQPQGLLQPIATGLMAGQQAYQGALDQQVQNQLNTAKFAEMKRKMDIQKLLPSLYAETTDAQGNVTRQINKDVFQKIAIEYPELAKSIAETQKLGKQVGLIPGSDMEAPSPFAPYLVAESPQVRTLATQLDNAVKRGIITEEQAVGRLPPLAQMEESYLRDRRSQQEAAAKAAEGKKPTEGERKTATLAGRLEGALKDLEKVPAAALKPEVLPSILQGLSIIPGAEMAAGKVSTEDRLRAEAAQLDALDAALTLGTGAAYTREQLRGYARSYFPQIGDTPKVIEEKNTRFERLVALAREQAGAAGSAIDIAKNKAKSFDKDTFKKEKGLE